MTAHTITIIVLECDGCDATIGTDAHYENALEARAAAYHEGWRFPNKTNSAGKTIKRNSDVGPKCAPTWQPEAVVVRSWTPEQREWMAKLATERRQQGNQ